MGGLRPHEVTTSRYGKCHDTRRSIQPWSSLDKGESLDRHITSRIQQKYSALLVKEFL